MPSQAVAAAALAPPPPPPPPGGDPSEPHAGQQMNWQAGQQQPMARLVIEEPRLSDEALYKCDVTYVKGKCPSISLVRLHMLSLPQRAQLTTASGQPLAPSTPLGPYNERDQLRLVCLVQGGRPAPRSVIWRRIDPAGRRLNLASSRYSTKAGKDAQSNLVEVELNHTLASADLGSRFECHVEHEALEPQLVVEAAAGDPSQAPPPPPPPRDALLDLHPFQPGPPEAAVATLKNPLDAHAYVELNVGVASLDLFLSKVNRRNSSEPLREGDLVELECVAYNSRPPANITWLNGAEWAGSNEAGATESPEVVVSRQKRLLQRSQVVPNADGHTYNTHSYLSIRLSRHEHRAQITCGASNGVPAGQPALTKSLELQVQHAPIVLMEPASGLQVSEAAARRPDLVTDEEETSNVITSAPQRAPANEPISIYCIYSANPSELVANSTRWFKDGQPLQLDSRRLRESQTSTGYPVLHIGQVNRRDAGLYECQLANAVGRSERLPASEQSRLEVLFRPSVRLRLFKRQNDEQEQEIDPEQELIQSGHVGFVLACEVLEANPSKIQRFLWHRWPLSGPATATAHGPQTVTTTTDTNRLHLSALPANFAGTGYACAAVNSLGTSDQSSQLELRLSHTPGPSTVSPVADAGARRAILASGRPARPAPPEQEAAVRRAGDASDEVVPAGKELMLECLTRQLGQPKANIWLWFKDGQPIEAPSSRRQDANEDTAIGSSQATTSAAGSDDLIPASNPHVANDNPITGQDLLLVANSSSSSNNNNNPHNSNTRLINSGRYLYISSVQLAHKGNYSCVAVNRLGSGGRRDDGGLQEHDSYRLSVALAPSFVQPLPARSYWPEVQVSGQLELVCQVQCEPLCQVEWLRNNEPIGDKQRHLSGAEAQQQHGSNYVHHQVSETTMEERPELNLFRGVESRLVLQFLDPGARGSRQASQQGGRQQQLPARDKILERRAQLSGANYTCQSSGNSMGPPVRSTTRFIVQYPPENVLITGPGDKLNIVEGSNGPRLSCEASGEPQVDYRWFLLRSGEAKLNLASSLNGSEWAGGHNPRPQHRANEDGPLLELTASAQHQVMQQRSMLDLSQLSIDKRQAGHYVCEASNRLGQTRQSVYLNVLYKPTCSALHLHSMDMIVEPPTEADKSIRIENGLVFKAKPFKANQQDEYRLIRETSDDFIGLRKTLVLSPLLSRYSGLSLEDDHLSLQGSIFGHVLSGKNQNQASLLQLSGEKASNLMMASVDYGKLSAASSETGEQAPTLITNSAWDRFNMLLLKFLNHYIGQIRRQEEMIESQTTRQQRRRSPTRGGQPDLEETTNELGGSQDEEAGVVKNLLTFACMAQDANPISNLTFEWAFGSSSLPEHGDQALDLADNSADADESNRAPPIKPMLVHQNANSTVHVLLVRRLDTRSSLNPFQVSLVTLDVVVESNNSHNNNGKQGLGPDRRDHQEASVGERRTKQRHNRGGGGGGGGNNIQSHEIDFGSRLFDGARLSELSEHNWQEQIGELLKCRISNQIGTSEACHVRVNIAERLRGSSSESSSSSSSEFAKWRMPSLASKSLVIIAILVACSLVILLTLTLAVGPQFRLLTRGFAQNRRRGDGVECKEGPMTNTGQSTSSQKSSVLGLLGNGESSIQGSSDDDCSGNQLSGAHLHPSQSQSQGQGQGQTATAPGRRMLDLDSMSLSRSVANGYHQHQHRHHPQANRGQMLQDSGEIGYDKPRDLQEQRVTYSNLGPGLGARKGSFHRDANNTQKAASAGSRLLANLRFKSLSNKLKVDKISDVSSMTSRLDLARSLHAKTGSSTETNTTGWSGGSNLDGEQQQSMATPMSSDSPTFFGPSAARQSITGGAQRAPAGGQPLNPAYYLYDDGGGLRNEALGQMQMQMVQSTPRQTLGSMAPQTSATYSNMMGAYDDDDDDADALEEFIRQREPLEAPHMHGAPMYLLKQDLSSQFTASTLDPRNHNYHQHVASSLYRSQMMNLNKAPAQIPVASRSSGQQQMLQGNSNHNTAFHQHQNNRFSLPVYDQQPFARPAHMDTIDTHLSRLAESVIQRGYYGRDEQQEPSSIAYANTVDRQVPTYGAYNPYQDEPGAQGHQQAQMVEHIYDVNAYATPEQTPLRRLVPAGPPTSSSSASGPAPGDKRPRVSQLIQTFSSRAPEP